MLWDRITFESRRLPVSRVLDDDDAGACGGRRGRGLLGECKRDVAAGLAEQMVAFEVSDGLHDSFEVLPAGAGEIEARWGLWEDLYLDAGFCFDSGF